MELLCRWPPVRIICGGQVQIQRRVAPCAAVPQPVCGPSPSLRARAAEHGDKAFIRCRCGRRAEGYSAAQSDRQNGHSARVCRCAGELAASPVDHARAGGPRWLLAQPRCCPAHRRRLRGRDDAPRRFARLRDCDETGEDPNRSNIGRIPLQFSQIERSGTNGRRGPTR